MQRSLRPHLNLLLILSFCALGLGASATADADQHRFVLRADLSGKACPSDLVIVEATGCKPAKLANQLVEELVAEGFDEIGFNATGCGSSGGGTTELVCFYHIPAGCTVERTSITVEAGDSCGPDDPPVTGRDFGMELGFHFFALDA